MSALHAVQKVVNPVDIVPTELLAKVYLVLYV